MSKINFFIQTAIACADNEGVFELETLKKMFPEKGKSYVSAYISIVKGKGLVEKVGKNKWRVVSSSLEGEEPETLKSAKRKILVLTREEREIFDLLLEVKTKCPDKSNGPRFTQDGVTEVLTTKNIPEKEWEELKIKLLHLKIIQEKGIGKKGRIFDLDQDLLLEYLTDESLIRISLWQDEKIRERLAQNLSDLRVRAQEILDIENAISRGHEKVALAQLELEELQTGINQMEKRLETEFPDRAKVLAIQSLLDTIEHLGEETTLSFIKTIIGE
ncbi:MAG: hypothetical protein PHP37_00250 [Patescibacteria group bacterium]|nr:hypothetical protein [Patescibacteria group bacterium]